MKQTITPESWTEIRRVADESFRSSFHFTIASVGSDGAPHAAPIGSVLLTQPGQALYFEIFASPLPASARVCIQGVNCGRLFWARALLAGRFPRPPGVRLYGHIVGERRAPTPVELARWRRRVDSLRWTRGYGLLWNKLEHVRDVALSEFEWVRLGKMTP